MFEPIRDQAAGLRRLFRPRGLSLLPLGCTTGDALDRAGATQLARALQRAGRRPLVIDLLGDLDRRSDRSGAMPAPGAGAPARDDIEHVEGVERIDAHRLLPAGADGQELKRLTDALRARAMRAGADFDIALIAADPLRLADLMVGLTDRIVLLARGESDALARVYSQIKALHLAHGLTDYFTTFRDSGSRANALASHRRLADTAARFLGAAIEFGGVVGAAQRDSRCWDRLAVDAMRWARPVGDAVAHRH